MPTDILLDEKDGTYVIVEGRVLEVTGSDLMLDAPFRRKSPGLRRALVHDQADGLTINYNSDYPGGVTINGVVAIHHRIGRDGLTISGLKEVHAFDDSGKRTIKLHGELLIEIPGLLSDGKNQSNRKSEMVGLQNLLFEMQGQIHKLAQRVNELEEQLHASK